MSEFVRSGRNVKSLDGKRSPIELIRTLALLGMIVIMLIAQFAVSPGIVSSPSMLYDYIMKLLVSVTSVGLMAAAAALVIITGCIDLSVGSTMTLTAIMSCSISSMPMYDANPTGTILLAIAVPVAVGLICGLFNGLLVGRLRLNAFMSTMSTMYVFQTLALLYNGGRFVSGRSNDALYAFVGRANLLNVPMPILLLILVFLAFGVVLHRTVVGRRVYAVGGNPTAAQFSGISFPRTITLVYALTGLMAGVAGLFVASWTLSADMSVGTGREFEVISACVLGGLTLSGGVGTMLGTVLGVLFMGTLKMFYIQFEITPMVQWIVQGVILLAVVYLNEVLERMKARRKGE